MRQVLVLFAMVFSLNCQTEVRAADRAVQSFAVVVPTRVMMVDGTNSPHDSTIPRWNLSVSTQRMMAIAVATDRDNLTIKATQAHPFIETNTLRDTSSRLYLNLGTVSVTVDDGTEPSVVMLTITEAP